MSCSWFYTDVIHTVGPVARGHVGKSQRELLKDCYQNSLKLIKDNGLRSVAFPCISTGIYGFPNEPAAEIALTTVKTWLKKNSEEVDRVIFCVFLDTDFRIYKEKMFRFFSQDNDVSDDGEETQPEEGKKDKKSKIKKPSKGDDDHEGEEEQKNKDDLSDANMDSQKGVDEQNESTDVEMASQNLDADIPDSEETKDKKDETATENVPATDLSRREERILAGERQSEDIDNTGDDAESRSSSSKDETKSPLTQMATAGEGGSLDKEHPVVTDDSTETGRSGELMDSEDVGVEPVPKDKASDEDTETSNGDVEMNTQGEDSQEGEITQADSNQSKEGLGNSEDP
ncbi:hypothetical protein AGOR_G00118260 [Albula goreensis]|uniref:Macro domain-containing protein n=1 Tax=Albula goreensis TaxID=1534307 RepID=A0A8T3DCZ3_9TELE|nr:hypothetical protein AGOR_G00118260 [Albula goreensis]